MIANLPKKLSTGKELTDQDSDSGSEKIIRKSIKKKRERKGNNKFHKSIPKVVVQSPDVQVKRKKQVSLLYLYFKKKKKMYRFMNRLSSAIQKRRDLIENQALRD